MSIAENRAEQADLYGVPLADVVHALTVRLRISQSRLAAVLGVSPAMLSQLVSGQRIAVRDPSVLHRLRVLQYRTGHLDVPIGGEARDALLTDVARLRWGFPGAS